MDVAELVGWSDLPEIMFMEYFHGRGVLVINRKSASKRIKGTVREISKREFIWKCTYGEIEKKKFAKNFVILIRFGLELADLIFAHSNKWHYNDNGHRIKWVMEFK